MPIYQKDGKSVLYVHVPKTAGSAVGAFFRKNGFQVHYFDNGGFQSVNRYRRCSPQHMHAEPILSILRPERFNYVFMTVRDPIQRLLSEFRMRSRLNKDTVGLPAWFDWTMKRYLEDGYVWDNHIRPQMEFLLPNCEVFRQEDGLGDTFVQLVEERLSIVLKHRTIGVVNKGEATDLDPADVIKVEPRVRQFYRQDYLTFGY